MSVSNASQRKSFQNYGLLIFISSLLGALFFIFVHYSQEGNFPSLRFQGSKYLYSIGITTLIGLIAFQIDHLLDKLIHWQNSFLIRFITGLGANLIMIVVLLTTVSTFLIQINGEELLKLIILFVITTFIYEIFYGLFYSYYYYAVTQARQLQSERWQLELQFASLKSQISPHYLFNCLNTVSSLLYKDTALAEEFIRRMADTFQYVLTHQKQKLVPLREELAFVKSYYFLLQIRYEYHLQLEINVPQNVMDTMIPPMTLQLLVENAVKHNAISKEQPLLIYISARDNTSLLIYNTKTQTIKPSSSFRVGLENIHKRYSFFTKENIVVRDEEKFFVQLPILKKGMPGIEAAS